MALQLLRSGMKNFGLLVFLPLAFLLISCERNQPSVIEDNYVYRKDMRNLVVNIAQKARATDGNFIIIPQNGQNVALRSFCQDCSTSIDQNYMGSIDAIGREDLNYGYNDDDLPNSTAGRREVSSFLSLYKEAQKPILVTDYCSTPTFVDDSYSINKSEGYVGFAAPSRELDEIPAYPVQPHDVHSSSVRSMAAVKNFLYLINPSKFGSRQSYLQALASTDYDLLIIDAFYDDQLLTKAEVNSLKTKVSGGTRLVVAYMSIGEAEDYRYYWDGSWESGSPEWIKTENPDWAGNYKIEYWNSEWHNLIYVNSDSYLNKLLASGFDGAYLDLIDAFEYFED